MDAAHARTERLATGRTATTSPDCFAGVVHTHAGYHVGLCATSSLVLGLVPGGDVMCVVATTGWITGQSYMIAASLLRHVPSVVLGGSIATPADRFAAVVERHGATVLKAGSTFIRMFMTQPGAGRLLAGFDLTKFAAQVRKLDDAGTAGGGAAAATVGGNAGNIAALEAKFSKLESEFRKLESENAQLRSEVESLKKGG